MCLAYTLRSYGARVVNLVKSYIHTAPPEQRGESKMSLPSLRLVRTQEALNHFQVRLT